MNHQYIPTIYSTPIDKLDGTNWWSWRNKIHMSLGRFGEAGEELRAEQRTTKYDVEEIRTDTIQYHSIGDDGDIRQYWRPWGQQDEQEFQRRNAQLQKELKQYNKDKGNLIAHLTENLSSDILNEVSNSPTMKDILAYNDVLALWKLIYNVVQHQAGQSPMVTWSQLKQRHNGILTPMTEFLLSFRGLMELAKPIHGPNPIDDATAVHQLLQAIDKPRYKSYTMTLQGAVIQPTFEELCSRLTAIDKEMLHDEKEADTANPLTIHQTETMHSLGYRNPYHVPTIRRGWIPPQSPGRGGRFGILGSRGSGTFTSPIASNYTTAKQMSPHMLPPITCYNCGQRGHLMRDCSMKPHQCVDCNNTGHLEIFCRLNNSRKRPQNFSPTMQTTRQRTHVGQQQQHQYQYQQRRPSAYANSIQQYRTNELNDDEQFAQLLQEYEYDNMSSIQHQAHATYQDPVIQHHAEDYYNNQASATVLDNDHFFNPVTHDVNYLNNSYLGNNPLNYETEEHDSTLQ